MVTVLSVRQACDILNENGIPMDANKLGYALQQRAVPFGVAIKQVNWSYQIYLQQLLEWIAERSDKQ